ncbi:Small GTPase [Entamoeba marina]
MEEKQNYTRNSPDVSICMIGCERVGKTTLVNIWAGEEFDEVYSKTDDVYCKELTVDVSNKQRHVVIWDCSGFDFKDNRGTVDSYITYGPIHVFVVSKNDKGSATFLKGFANSIFYRKATPLKKYLIVTKENEEDETKDILDELVSSMGLQRFDVDAKDIDKVKTILTSIVKDNVIANPVQNPPKERKKRKCTIL